MFRDVVCIRRPVRLEETAERMLYRRQDLLEGRIVKEGALVGKGQSLVVTAVLVLAAIVGFALQG